MSSFAHLHCHSEYSFQDGIIRIDDLCAKAHAVGMKACALTDHGGLFGMPAFLNACRGYGLKPIPGCEVYVCPDINVKGKDASGNDVKANPTSHLVLLAKNNEGWNNLIKIVNASYLEGFYYRPRVDKKILAKHSGGIVALSACLSGEIPKAILAGDMDLARDIMFDYADHIFPHDFYLEIQRNGLAEQEKVNAGLLELACRWAVPYVATNDCHYLDRDDAVAQDAMFSLRCGKTLNDPDRMRMGSNEFYFKSGETMERQFRDLPKAIEKAADIAAACEVADEFKRHYFPVCELPAGETAESELRRAAVAGLAAKLGNNIPASYLSRLEYELSVIIKMGFCDYFLVIRDCIAWAKSRSIPVGPGRGSAAGSLVAYALGITAIDPLEYGLLFERFLNPDRVSLPDVDIDFCKLRRDEVLAHMTEKYGADNVARIGTFTKLKTKSVTRDAARAVGMTPKEVDDLANMVSDGDSVREAFAKGPIDARMQTELHFSKLFRLAKKLEGVTKNAGEHAAGLVIAGEPLADLMPLCFGKKKSICSQYDKNAVESLGFVKFDFLGLKTLTVIDKAIKSIRENHGVVVDLDKLPLDDPAVWDIYADGKTLGIFQVEGEGLTAYLREMKPASISELALAIALYRPGPMGESSHESYIRRKKGVEPVTNEHELLNECLSESYGLIVYQEQVMEAGRLIGGMSLKEADEMRRAMSKKNEADMERQRGIFLKGAAHKGISRNDANVIFDKLAKFAHYGFNKSHAVAYAFLSYQTAWLKAHYPDAYMTALLDLEADNREKMLDKLSECMGLGYRFERPSINNDSPGFQVKADVITMGLCAIKGIGKKAIGEIEKAKKAGGAFASLADFCQRVDRKKINAKVATSLVMSGAFDGLDISRKAMLDNIKTLWKKQGVYEIKDVAEFEESELTTQELDVFDMCLRPLALPPGGASLAACADLRDGKKAICNVMTLKVNEKADKNGHKYANIKATDGKDVAWIRFFAEEYAKISEFLKPGICLEIQVSYDNYMRQPDDGIKLIGKTPT